MQQLPTSDDQSNNNNNNNNNNNDKTSLMSHQQPSTTSNNSNQQQHHYFTPDDGEGDEDDDGVVIMSSNAVSSSVSSSTAFSHLYNQPSHIQQNAKLTKYSTIHHAHRKLPKRIRNAFIQPPSDADDDERRRNGRPNFDDDDGDYSDVDEEELEEEEKFGEERRRTNKRRSKLGDEEENEPTSTTVLENHHDDEACEPHVEADGERDHVHDLSSVIPPDTITFFENVCPKLKFELSLSAIWNLTMISVFIFGVIFGLLFGDSCKEFYNTTLLINTEESSTSSRRSTNRAEEKTQMALVASKVEYETHIPAPEPHYDPSSSSSRDTEHPSISDCIWATVSSCLGWSYFLAWVISFLPQLYTNWTRKSVVGQSIAFAYTNLLGFSCYAVFNTALYTSTEIKKQYQERFHSKNDVEINDVWYAVFATICCTVNVYQCLVYERGGQKVAKVVLVFIFSSLLLLGAWLVLIFMFYNPPDDENNNKQKENIYLLNPLDFLYGVGIVKVLVTLFKYAPQVLLNYKRKKTVGVSISMWLLDFSGGMMSLTQELLDAGLRDAWVEVEGNWVKLSLSVISMSYDTIFILQHYVFYAKNNEKIISEYKRKMRAHRIRELAIHGGNAEGEIDGGREVIVVENGGGSRKKRRSKNHQQQQLASCDEDVQIDESNNAMV